MQHGALEHHGAHGGVDAPGHLTVVALPHLSEAGDFDADEQLVRCRPEHLQIAADALCGHREGPHGAHRGVSLEGGAPSRDFDEPFIDRVRLESRCGSRRDIAARHPPARASSEHGRHGEGQPAFQVSVPVRHSHTSLFACQHLLRVYCSVGA